MLECGGCEGRSTAPLHSRSVRCDELSFRSSTQTFSLTTKLQHIRSRLPFWRNVAPPNFRRCCSLLLVLQGIRPSSVNDVFSFHVNDLLSLPISDVLSSYIPRVRRRASIGREQAKRAATASRRATPVARERNPTTSLAQERVPHAQRRIARERVHRPRLIKSANPRVLRRDAFYTLA